MATVWRGIRIADILQASNNYRRYIAWKGGRIRHAVFDNIQKVLRCRTVSLGVHLFRCHTCGTIRVVPHSCKSRFCSSCGKARTDAWCRELLPELPEVKYRHLIFTLPWEVRLPIQDNRNVLMDVLFRALAAAILSLTLGYPEPLSRKGRKWRERCRRTPRYRPGFIAVIHTFGSDLKWNVHFHVVITNGGLRADGERWVYAPKRYLVPVPLLAMEWKLNVIEGIRQAHEKNPLFCRRLRGDHRRRVDIDQMLGHVRKKRWHILIGPSLQSADGAVRYACRYTKRPVLAEGRIVSYKAGRVGFLFKDYHKGGTRQFKSLPVLRFVDRLVQHIPERQFRQVRYYGIFATAVRTHSLERARQLLARRKKRRLPPVTWELRRKAAGDTKPLSCPRCGDTMKKWSLMFGAAIAMAMILGVKAREPIPAPLFIDKDALRRGITSRSITLLQETNTS